MCLRRELDFMIDENVLLIPKCHFFKLDDLKEGETFNEFESKSVKECLNKLDSISEDNKDKVLFLFHSEDEEGEYFGLAATPLSSLKVGKII